MRLKHIIEAQQFTRNMLSEVFSIADLMAKNQPDKCLEGKIMICLFYEPSTRTRFSFESAMLRLGGAVISTENASEFSSAAKGETLEDTIRVVNGYGNIIVLRHFEEGAAKRAARVSMVPVINAGDGPGQHPTQALLDLYTIQKELSRIDGISIAMVGDLKNGRTARSLSYLLGKYKNIQIYFVSPEELRMGDDIKNYLNKHKIKFSETDNLGSVIPKVDVLYQTRIQKERFKAQEDYERLKNSYVINKRVLGRFKKDAIIMHPLPRVNEIAPEVDNDKRAAYFRQARNGLYIRMALLRLILT